MMGFRFISHNDTTENTFSTGHLICEKCGKAVQTGIMNVVNHASECHVTTVEYKTATDNEIREFFLELGMPNLGFEAMGYAKPTEMERKIFKDNSSLPQ